MATHAIELELDSTAPPEALFAVFADGAAWASYARPWITASGWAHRGDGPLGGVGDVRYLFMGPLKLREETVEYDAPHRHVYTMLQPAPVKDYLGTVTITPTATGSHLHWKSEFSDRIPGSGAVIAGVMKPGLAQVARKLVAAAERLSTAG